MGKQISDAQEMAVRLKAIIDTTIDGIITMDDKGIVESINKSAARLFEYQPEEVIGQNIKMLMPEPDKSHHDSYLEKYRHSRVPKIVGIGREVKGEKKDGTIFPFRLAVSEVVINNKIVFTGIIHDLSDIKLIEKELRSINTTLESKVEARTQELEDVVNELLKSNRLLEGSQKELKLSLTKEKELNVLKTRFVSMASHEFRTPLSTILSSASIISKYTNEDQHSKRQKHVDRIKSSVENLTGILNDFLSLSRLEEGVINLNVDTININELCDNVVSELKDIIKSNQIVSKKIYGTKHIFKTDQRILKNILFNLLSNAIKYSSEGTCIDCFFTFTDKTIEIKITDKGIGIPQNEQQYLFDRFFRATNAETIKGTGLGLNIVRRYVDLLNGRISFTSVEGVGSTFIVTLPLIIQQTDTI